MWYASRSLRDGQVTSVVNLLQSHLANGAEGTQPRRMWFGSRSLRNSRAQEANAEPTLPPFSYYIKRLDSEVSEPTTDDSALDAIYQGWQTIESDASDADTFVSNFETWTYEQFGAMQTWLHYYSTQFTRLVTDDGDAEFTSDETAAVPLIMRMTRSSTRQSGAAAGTTNLNTVLDRMGPWTFVWQAEDDDAYTRHATEEDRSEGQVERPQCAVTLDRINVGDVVTRLPCGHLGMQTSMLQSLVENGRCPICRRLVVTADNEALAEQDQQPATSFFARFTPPSLAARSAVEEAAREQDDETRTSSAETDQVTSDGEDANRKDAAAPRTEEVESESCKQDEESTLVQGSSLTLNDITDLTTGYDEYEFVHGKVHENSGPEVHIVETDNETQDGTENILAPANAVAETTNAKKGENEDSTESEVGNDADQLIQTNETEVEETIKMDDGVNSESQVNNEDVQPVTTENAVNAESTDDAKVRRSRTSSTKRRSSTEEATPVRRSSRRRRKTQKS